MKTRQTLILILMLTVLTQAACAAIPTPSTIPIPTIAATTPTAGNPPIATDTGSSCPTPTSDTKLLTNTEVQYCLLYPAEYAATEPQAIEVDPAVVPGGMLWQQDIIINPISAPGDMPGDAWLYIQVQDAAGKTAAQFADEAVSSLGADFNITRTDVRVCGEPAIMVDGLPGQDSNRQVFIVHNGRLYILIFMPWYPNAAEPTPLENLSTMVMDTFHFLP